MVREAPQILFSRQWTNFARTHLVCR